VNRKSLYHLVLTALLAALAAALTSIHIVNLPNGGYVHLGDLFVFLAGCLLPTPHAMAAAAIGGGLADLFTSNPAYILPTVVIKSSIALCFSAKREKILCPRNALALLPAAAITMGGYFLAEWAILNWPAALLTLPANLLQAIGSAALFAVLGFAMDRAGLKRRL
jgi:uncharacterized repeat protein (TIGR04002 family)